ncbi:chondroitin sulfate proteoglycan 4 [Patella vulgata]|uniref:chondroitin sulfate proteoglycan 4 n=1 Tax=Patella vulgata TaxID=6465 RepID=UPI00217F378C|nr:chondroitin sulfate proteoglycan 4 [Patella vulgata]
MHQGNGPLVLAALTLIWNLADAASFYGESYVRVPFQLSAGTNQVDLDFKTHRPHGLLLLAAGNTDYFSLELSSGIIKVQVDLGSGAAILNSPPSLRLDDSQWHHISVNRSKEELVLTVDEIVTSSTAIPGKFSELNIKHGIFLGGIGTFTDVYDGNFKYFRGCLKDTFFNKYDILGTARNMKNPVNTYEVSWDCDTEFDAGSDQPITFMSDSSFLAFPPLHIREKGTFSCDLKTRSKTSVIFFNAGRRTTGLDYIGLELINGKLKLTANKGSGVIDVYSDNKVNNGRWHQIDVVISPSMLELRVDGTRNVTRFYSKDNKYHNLAGHLYVGGISVKDKANAIRRGLESLKYERGMRSSTKGCIRNVVINSRTYGFREVVVSRLVDPKCSYEYPCASDPCIADAKCSELENNEYRCVCDQNVCTKSTVTTMGEVGERNSADVLAIEQLKVQEGGLAYFTTNVVDVIFDYMAYRIRESAIQFTIKIPPRYGSIDINIRRRRNEDIFTLLDLIGGKVSYVHDGSDTRTDDVTLEMKVTATDSSIPKRYLGNFGFVVPIKIAPRNDPPKLVLPSGTTIQVMKHTKTLISDDILSVDDPDTLPADIIHTITYINTENGHFVKENETKTEVTEFTQADVDSGLMWYIHEQENLAAIRLKVSDGTTESSVLELRLRAVDIDISIPINNGIIVALGTSSLILPDNLTSATNVRGQNIELRYRILEKPKYGHIQRRKHEDHKWINVETFSQRHIDKERLRYVNDINAKATDVDEFKFVVNARESSTIENTFQISFQKVSLQTEKNVPLVLNDVVFLQISSRSLSVKANSASVPPDKIHFKMVRPPSQGQLYKIETDPKKVNERIFDRLSPLTSSWKFTQEDLNDGKIFYKLSRPSFKRVEDFVDLKVTFENAKPLDVRLSFKYLPEQTSIRFTNNGLKNVIEGGSKVIGREDLYLEMDGVKEIKFTLISKPEFGLVTLQDPRTNAVLEKNVTEFTSKDIREGKLQYKHDDSEHDQDSFTFIALPLLTEEDEAPEEIQEISGRLDVEMMMRNDNPPVRDVDKVFHVVKNKNKKITVNDVSFHDPDINYDSADLQYTRRGIPNGEIVDAKTGSPVYQFTHQDIIDQKLLFQHQGDDYGRAALWVTDGQFYTTSLFEVQASAPFIKIGNNTGITVKKGSYSPITNSNLSMETNVNARPNQINVLLIEEPLYGHLRIKGKQVAEFTYDDLLKGNVKFWHDGSTNQEDRFKFAFIINNAKVQGIFTIIMYLESQLRPPQVTHNRLLEVAEGSGAIITQSHLNVNHPDSIPTDITYTITTKPQYGAIYVKGVLMPDDEATIFTQQDIINDYVKYTNTKSGIINDKFAFDVSNQFQTLRNVEFFIEIVPNVLQLDTDVLSVMEGERSALLPKQFKLKGRYFQGKDVVFEIQRQPQSGIIDSTDNKGVLISKFTTEDLRLKKIFYEHDGSERTEDEFTVTATLSDNLKTSLPHIVKIHIESVNDQTPRIIVNSILEVWKGSVTRLTNHSLLAEDLDSTPKEIIFRVSSPTNGHLAYLQNTFHQISQFSQQDINNGRVVFVHEGGNSGEFNIQVTDGINNGRLQVFIIEARPLTLTLVVNQPLQAFPATLQPITQDVLLYSTNADNVTKPITYTLETRPKRGKIVTVENGIPLEVASFTQKEVENSEIYYQHAGNIHHWSETDSFLFEVSTVYAEPLKEELMEIQISYGNVNRGNSDLFLRTSIPLVREGSEITISQDNLDVSQLERRLYQFGSRVAVDFMLIDQPTNGHLERARQRMSNKDTFTQAEINKGIVKYFHDDTDTSEDRFTIAVQIHPPDSALTNNGIDSYVFETNFTIGISPVNDQTFELLTKTPSIQVIQGQAMNITNQQLKTTDKDTGPKDLVYEIRTPPKHGRLVVGVDTGKSVTMVTQQDIDDHKLLYINDGSKGPDSFFFRVSDGVHNPYYKTFNIYVLPITIDVNSHEPIELVQSESSVYISPKSLNITTNGKRDKVWYNVTKEPAFGRIYYQESLAQYFSQSDVDKSLMLYIQSDLSVGADHFVCDVYVEGVDLFVSGQRFDITVKPLVKQGPLNAPSGSKVAITKYNLDASRLAAITGDNPVFDITEQPQLGHIVKVSRNKRDLNVAPIYEQVNYFTHEDVVYTKVYYKADERAKSSAASDKFSYTLKAKNVQPASGSFTIDLQPAETTTLQSVDGKTNNNKPSSNFPVITVSPRTSTPSQRERSLESPDDNDGDGTYIIIIIVIAVVVLLLFIVIVIVVVLRRRKIKQEKELALSKPKPRPYISGPLQLEQPHVHIEPQQCLTPLSDEDQALVISPSHSSNIPVINASHNLESPTQRSRSPDISRVEVSHAVPSCKVTPLIEIPNNTDDNLNPAPSSANSNNSADLFNFDWTLMDPELLQHCRTDTPVLRQNQYWV